MPFLLLNSVIRRSNVFNEPPKSVWQNAQGRGRVVSETSYLVSVGVLSEFVCWWCLPRKENA